MPKPADFWNDRFSTDQYIYGVEPNDFVKETSATWLTGPLDVLDLGVGEGRNAVHLAQQVHTVAAADFSVEELREHFDADDIERLEGAEPMLDEGMHKGPGATVNSCGAVPTTGRSDDACPQPRAKACPT